MNDDDLLRAAAKLQRDDEARSATLRGQTLEAPLDDDFRQRLRGRLVDSLETVEDVPPAGTDESAGGKVLHGRFGRVGTWLAPLAVAAGLAFFLLPQTSVPPLPSYGMELRGQVQQQRSAAVAPQDLPEFLPNGTLEMTLRPASAVEDALEVRAVALSEAGEVHGLRFDIQISEQGAVQLRSKVEDLGLDAGTWTILVVAARSGQIPELEELTEVPPHDDLTQLRQPIHILAPSTQHE